MKRKILLLTALLSVAMLFVTSCKDEPEPYPTDINVKNFPEFPTFPEDRRIPAPEFTYTVSGDNSVLKWKNLSYVESYIIYLRVIDGNYIVGSKSIELKDLQYDSDFSSNKTVSYTISNSTFTTPGTSGLQACWGLRAISVDGIKSDIYWVQPL